LKNLINIPYRKNLDTKTFSIFVPSNKDYKRILKEFKKPKTTTKRTNFKAYTLCFTLKVVYTIILFPRTT